MSFIFTNPTNRGVSRDFRGNTVTKSVRDTIPRIEDASVFPAQPKGSIVYDLATDTIWYSNGVTWLPLNAATSGVVLDSITIYVNAGTGSDTNDGLTSATAVATIQKGIDILGTFLTNEGILQLEGTTPFDLGVDPTLNFFPATSFSGNIIVRGTQLDTISDTVASIPSPSGIGPFDTWTVVNGTSGGYPVSDYLSHFIHNTTQDRIYTVLDNGVSSVDTITGNGAPNGLEDAWVVGNSFTLFKVQTIIEFSGTLTILNPQNTPLLFEYVWVQPASGATWTNVQLPVTTFRGCRLDVYSERAYTGSMNIEGCYSKNVMPVETLFCASEQHVCRRINSFWLDGPSIVFNDSCFAAFFNCTNSIQEIIRFNIQVESGDFQGFSIMISNSLSGQQMLCEHSSIYTLENIDFTNRTDTSGAVDVIKTSEAGQSVGSITNAKLTNVSTQLNSNCVNFSFGGKIHFVGSVDFTSTGRCMRMNGGASATMFSSGGSFSMVTSSRGTIFDLDNASELSIRLSGGSMTHTFTSTAALSANNFMILKNGSRFLVNNASGGGAAVVVCSADNPSVFDIDQYSAVVLTNTSSSVPGFTFTNVQAGGNIVTARHSSNYCDDAAIVTGLSTYSALGTTIDLQTGSNATITQPITDTTAATLVSCGNAVAVPGPGPYSTSLNDYSAAPPQNCSITFG
jgi:hypothetical protein